MSRSDPSRAVFLDSVGSWWLNKPSCRGRSVRWSSTTLVTADAGLAVRMLGDQEISLDKYIDHNYLQPLLPEHMSEGEVSVLHYFDSSRITSEAAAVLSSLAGPYADNLAIRSARDVNANDLTHGDFIFLGSNTSAPSGADARAI